MYQSLDTLQQSSGAVAVNPARSFHPPSQLGHDGLFLLARKETAVPIAVRITPSNMTRDDYERVMQELEESESASTDGRVFHASYGEEEVHMFDVWESHESFQPYHENLVGLLQGAGIDAGVVQIEPVHNTIDR
jgi:hypothetical protein